MEFLPFLESRIKPNGIIQGKCIRIPQQNCELKLFKASNLHFKQLVHLNREEVEIHFNENSAEI